MKACIGPSDKLLRLLNVKTIETVYKRQCLAIGPSSPSIKELHGISV